MGVSERVSDSGSDCGIGVLIRMPLQCHGGKGGGRIRSSHCCTPRLAQTQLFVDSRPKVHGSASITGWKKLPRCCETETKAERVLMLELGAFTRLSATAFRPGGRQIELRCVISAPNPQHTPFFLLQTTRSADISQFSTAAVTPTAITQTDIAAGPSFAPTTELQPRRTEYVNKCEDGGANGMPRTVISSHFPCPRTRAGTAGAWRHMSGSMPQREKERRRKHGEARVIGTEKGGISAHPRKDLLLVGFSRHSLSLRASEYPSGVLAA